MNLLADVNEHTELMRERINEFQRGRLTMGIRENKAKNLPFGDRFVF